MPVTGRRSARAAAEHLHEAGRRLRRPADTQQGSAVAEFVMVVSLLTVLTLAVLQLGLALHVRNTVLDAAAEGARFAALAGNSLPEGTERTRDLITVAIGATYARSIDTSRDAVGGYPRITVRVQAPLPMLGLFGPPRGLEVSGHAALESPE
ncbi:MAG: TadE/TadG family type IV pilus assembly protein [Cryobacterium sp.]